MFGRRITGPGIRRISGPLSLSPVFLVFVGQYKPYTLELVSDHSNSLSEFLSPCFSGLISTRILEHYLEFLCSIQIIIQLDATVSKVYYSTFICDSTCFGRLHAHYQELTTALTL